MSRFCILLLTCFAGIPIFLPSFKNRFHKMQSQFSESDSRRAAQTLQSLIETIQQLTEWNKSISSANDYYLSQTGMQLLAANCTLITAIGEGISRINRVLPGFLENEFPSIPWHAIIGMRNHIAHGYFELDADLIFEAIKNDIPPLFSTITEALKKLS